MAGKAAGVMLPCCVTVTNKGTAVPVDVTLRTVLPRVPALGPVASPAANPPNLKLAVVVLNVASPAPPFVKIWTGPAPSWTCDGDQLRRRRSHPQKRADNAGCQCA